ncbi:MAG: hypothetical protein ACXWV2_05690 [Chitinophagaceae bacterium]
MNTILKYCCFILLTVLLGVSCKREVEFTSKPGDLQEDFKNNEANRGAFNNCRLTYTDYGDGLFTENYGYNARGLVNDLRIENFGFLSIHATMQYDSWDRLSKGTLSYDDVTVYDFVFEYKHNRIVKETYYEQGTSVVYDEVTNTYNWKGQIIKRDDPPFDYYATFEYDIFGNLTKSEARTSGGELVTREEYKYRKSTRDPSTARPGLPYSFWYLIYLEAGPFVDWTRDVFIGDGAGGEFKVYDENPEKTVITRTAKNLASSRLTFDEIAGIEYHQYWEYENCGGKNAGGSPGHKSMPKTDQRSQDVARLKMPLLTGRQLRPQLAEKKAIWQRLKGSDSKMNQ